MAVLLNYSPKIILASDNLWLNLCLAILLIYAHTSSCLIFKYLSAGLIKLISMKD